MTREESERPARRDPKIGPAVWWLGLATTGLATLVLSLVAYREGITYPVPHGDKAVHLTIGGALAFFLDGVLRRRALRLGPVHAPLAAVLVLAPAGIEEILQRFSPNRSSSFADFAADIAGVALGVWLSRRVDG